MTSRSAGARLNRRRLIRLATMAAVVVVLIVAVLVVPLWWNLLVPRWVNRGLIVAALWTVFAVDAIGLIVAPGLGLVLLRRIGRSRRLGRRWLGLARGVMVCVSWFFGSLVLETGALAGRAWVHRLPELPTQFPRTSTAAQANRPLRIVVVGESSARGEPYNPWLSVPQIVAPRLQEILGRRVEIDMRAFGGINLEQAIDRVKGLDKRPDAVLLFCGHNEFQTRFGWKRAVTHYRDREPWRPPQDVLLQNLAGWSPLCRLVDEALERHWLDVAPPREITRSLVDVPCCSPEEYRAILADFRRRVEHLASYCDTIGALPILIVPVSNEADYEPNRSVLAAEVPAAECAAFAREFQAARALEATDPAAALVRFQTLLRRAPGFAETHYRLARLLERVGRWQAARAHQVKARDLDAMPTRCPSDFQQVYRDVAARHHAILIDSPAVFSARSARHGLFGDDWLGDAHHPNLRGYVALAQDLLRQLRERRALGWPEGRDVPVLVPGRVAREFGMETERWAAVCARSATFYQGAAYIRHDPTDRLRHADRYARALQRLAAGAPITAAGLPGFDGFE